jgi:hypothetical protein
MTAPATATKQPYLLIAGTDVAAVCQQVTEALTDGYRLYGSPAASFDGSAAVHSQALVLDIAIDKSGALR